jgi:hypothetical protein
VDVKKVVEFGLIAVAAILLIQWVSGFLARPVPVVEYTSGTQYYYERPQITTAGRMANWGRWGKDRPEPGPVRRWGGIAR